MRSITVVILMCLGLSVQAQSYRDTAVFQNLVSVSYGIHQPLFDLGQDFGLTHSIGVQVDFKLKNNWIFGVDGYFLFSGDFKSTDWLSNLTTSDGYILNASGSPAIVEFGMRGFQVQGVVGKVFPWFGPNPNSGIMLKLGVGNWFRKLGINNSYDNIPALTGDYRKGYDHLTVGGSGSLFMGYLYHGKQNWLHFSAGLEFGTSVGKNIRPYNFYEGGAVDDLIIDGLIGARVSWVIPIGGKSDSYYY